MVSNKDIRRPFTLEMVLLGWLIVAEKQQSAKASWSSRWSDLWNLRNELESSWLSLA